MAIPAATSWRVRDLKEYVATSQNQVPIEDQHWIIGGALPTDNTLLVNVLEKIQPGKTRAPSAANRIYRAILYVSPFYPERVLMHTPPHIPLANRVPDAHSLPPVAGANSVSDVYT